MIIRADRIVIRPDRGPLANGAIVVKYGRIHDIGKAEQIIRCYPGNRTVRMEHAVLMPGLVNAHVHLELPPLLDRIHATNYTTWVLNLLKARRLLGHVDHRSAARRNIRTAIETGTTTLAEICTHNASPAVIYRSGLRAVIYHEIISMDQAPRRLTLPRSVRSSRLIRHGLSPHSTHTVSGAVLAQVKSYAARRRMGICMHVAETKEELRLFQQKKSSLERLYDAAGWDKAWAPTARSSFEFLQRIDILSPAFLAVHAVHIDDIDIALIRRSGAGIAHCPRSNRGIGVGKMPLRKIMDAEIPVGLGTDSLASSPNLNLWEEMRYALKIHRSSGITPRDILQIATLGGAQALGMEREIGSLEPGKKADLIAVSLPRKDTGDISSDLLRETKSCSMTMVNGNIIYRSHGVQRT